MFTENTLVQVKGALRDFILAGNCLFTLANRRTGNHFTYRVRTPEEQRDPKNPVWFVQVLCGPDNGADYHMIGMLFNGERYAHWNKSRFLRDCPSEVAFVWLIARLLKNAPLPEGVDVYHHGRCGRCGRLLTVPSSIEMGLGPECAAKSLW